MADKRMFPFSTKEIAEKKGALALANIEAWRNFSKTVFKTGLLDEKTKTKI